MLMGSDTVLEVDGVSKIFSRQRRVTRDRLGSDLRRVIFGRPYDPRATDLKQGEFFAVKDVSFSLKRGEAFGIIGLNGSGKTTLLRLLAGQMLPDGGQIRVSGRTASMIDLTAGFEVNASGRDNVFLRGAALGRTRAEMEAAYQDIVDFAEIGDAIAAPVATYSSGMMMRLAFAIVSNTAPDLLFIDEVLAVGDFQFRQKCLARVRELREHCGFVMVSHSMNDIVRFCDNAIVLHKGNIVFKGPSADAAKYFETEIENETSAVQPKSVNHAVLPFFENNELISDLEAHWSDEQGNKVSEIVHGATAWFDLKFRCSLDARKLIVGVPVWSSDGVLATAFSTEKNFASLRSHSGDLVSIRLTIPKLLLNPGTYHSNTSIVDGTEFLWRGPNDPVRVRSAGDQYWGLATMPYDWVDNAVA